MLYYPHNTQNLALQLRSEDNFIIASDASFTNNSIDWKSLQTYTMKLFSNLVGWRANK